MADFRWYQHNSKITKTNINILVVCRLLLKLMGEVGSYPLTTTVGGSGVGDTHRRPPGASVCFWVLLHHLTPKNRYLHSKHS